MAGGLGKETKTVTFSLCYVSLSPGTAIMCWTVIKQYLTALHGVWQALQFPVGYRHVVLAHGSILEAPAFAVVIDELSCFAGEKQGFLIVLLADVDNE